MVSFIKGDSFVMNLNFSRRFLNRPMRNLLQPLHSNLLQFLKPITGVIT